jgi:hypothetical protein
LRTFIAESLLDKWQSSLEMIHVASEENLAVVEKAELVTNLHVIKPDAQFLFRKTINLHMNLISPAVSINTSLDPFAIIHFMPDLQELVLQLDRSVKRFNYFTPTLPKLRYLGLMCRDCEFAPTAFDHLVGLEDFSIHAQYSSDGYLKKFETGVAPRSLHCFGVNILKLNSAAVNNIKHITAFDMIESMQPLSQLETLQITTHKTADFSIMCHHKFANLQLLSISLNDLSRVDQGQLSCLSELRKLFLSSQLNFTGGTYLND